MKPNLNTILITAALAAFTCNANAVEYFKMDDGNLVLGFQATSGTGASFNVLFDLGSPIALRNNGNLGVLGNIGGTLAEVYGNDWHTREDVWFGVVANLNQNPNSGIGSRGAVNGDPSRTFYLSIPASTPGTSRLYPAGTYSSAALGVAGSNLTGLETLLRQIDNGWNLNDPDPLAQGLIKRADGTGVLDQNLPQHNVAWSNGWTHHNPTPGPALQIFTGGIQQNFGGAGSEKHVDIQRVLSTNTGANPTGVVGGGTYVSTISISSSGQISANVASTGGGDSPFEEWVATFPALVASPNEADRSPEGDFDKDGIPNIREFAFGGSPVSASDNGQQQLRTVDANGDSQRDLTLTVEVRSGTTFAPSGNKLTATQDGVLYTIEGSLDLVNFESAVSEVTPTLGTGTPKAGYVFKTFRLNASSGLGGKGFIRAGAVVAP